MRIDPKLRILTFLVVGAFVMSLCSAREVLAAGTGSKHAGFKAAQTKAQIILANKAKANTFGAVPTEQFNVPANTPTVCYGACPPGWSRPVYTWFIPAQPYSGSQGQPNVAGGGWQTPAGQGATVPLQNVAPPAQAPPATDGGGSRSLCYWLPSWATTNWWNSPATSGGSSVPNYNQLAQPGSTGANPTTVCYSGCVPSWNGSGYTTGTYCAPVCY